MPSSLSGSTRILELKALKANISYGWIKQRPKAKKNNYAGPRTSERPLMAEARELGEAELKPAEVPGIGIVWIQSKGKDARYQKFKVLQRSVPGSCMWPL